MISITLQAPAKINIGLYIGELDADGYHRITTYMQTIDLNDEITICKAERFTFNQDVEELPLNEGNLCVKAYRALKDYVGERYPVAIELRKHIPTGAGLGGGSSDAAAVIVGLNRLWRLGLGKREMASVGANIGSDVPFFILSGGSGLCEGRGEIVTPLKPVFRGWVALIFTGVSINTGWAYKIYDDYLTFSPKNTNLKNYLLNDIPAEKGLSELRNMFEEPVFQYFRDLERVKFQLKRLGASYSSLSGSGSAVFGLFESEDKAKGAVADLAGYPFTTAIRTPAPLYRDLLQIN